MSKSDDLAAHLHSDVSAHEEIATVDKHYCCVACRWEGEEPGNLDIGDITNGQDTLFCPACMSLRVVVKRIIASITT